MTQRVLTAFCLGALLFAAGAQAHAQAQTQAYPSKPIRMVVGFAAGGSTDKLARVLATRMGELMGTSVVVDNRPGAAGNIAAEAVATAAPDGYTIFMATLSSQAINPHLYAKLKFDPIRSFEPVGLVAKYPLLLVVPPQLQLNSVQDLVTYAKANPGTTFFASAGNGSPAHLAGEIFKATSAVDVRHVPYRGGGPALLALMSNEAQFAFETIPSAIGHARGGKLKALGVTSTQRSTAAPELPTMVEAGLKGFTVTSWAGLLAPAGTPKDVVDKLGEATRTAIASANVKSALESDGAEPGTGGAEEFSRFMKDELKAWGQVVRTANAKVD
ncbi:tripartite tricarboxylate transporter substrate binding protein [Variovorax sp. KK3]|uniref:Bug family tripartite tricarboxylate transporter substrate binding protein n=1 Tax=Variovorax sp. KK3 TaxID=1855728 RepID=UPI00097C9D63|nr:tripartite tricarboxylate transporter substrate binding protein [Variovorax sp. KK3]